MATGYHDGDHTTTLMAVSSSDGKTPVVVWADPSTHRLLTTSTGGAVTIYTETPTGAIDGVNTTYTTAHTITGIFSFAINGQYLHPQDVGAGTGDYTYSGSTITFLSPLPAGLSGTAFTIVYE